MLLRGRANLGLNKHDAAKADADTGLKLRTQDVNESRLYHLRGDIEAARNNAQEAKSNYMLVAQLGPFDEVAADAFRKLITVLDQLGEADTAAKIRAEYKLKFPNEPEVPQGGAPK
jgi:predicted negative regulator of RcsB-dependent stress response